MTQDEYGVRDEAAAPVTHFQKVAPALRDGAGQEDPAAPAGPPWEVQQDEPVAVTSPDVPVTEAPADADHAETEPDMFGGAVYAPVAGAAANGAAGVPEFGGFSDLSYGNLIPDAARYTAQWQQIQYKFVDDPQASVTEAADIIAQVTAKMEAAIQERQRAIEERQRVIAEQQRSLRGRWSEGTNADTEALRETLRMYRTFLDQLIGPGPAN